MFEITVDLAVGYTLDMALSHNPKLDVSFSLFLFFCLLINYILKLQPIGQCTGLAPDNIYLETNKNTSFPYHNQSSSSGGPAGIDVNGDGGVVGSGSSGSAANAGFTITIPILSSILMLGIGLSSSIMF